MSGNNSITICGNLGDDPELRFTAQGVPVASMRVAVSDRRYDPKRKEWFSSDPVWFTVTCWRALAENIAESLSKGDAVIATGTMQAREWADDDGVKHVAWDLVADQAGAGLRTATVKVARNPPPGGNGDSPRDDPPRDGAPRGRGRDDDGRGPQHARDKARSRWRRRGSDDQYDDEPPY